MEGKIESIQKVVATDSELPDGTYSGTIGGYVVKIIHNEEEYHIKTTVGVRGINIKCTVKIEGDNITIN